MLDAHDDAIIAAGGHTKDRRQPLWLDAQRVVAPHGSAERHALEDPCSVVVYGGRMPVDGGMDLEAAAERHGDGLVPEADPEHRDDARERADGLDKAAGLFGPAGAWSEDTQIGRSLEDLPRVDLIAADNLDAHADLGEALREVVSKRVVGVDQEEAHNVQQLSLPTAGRPSARYGAGGGLLLTLTERAAQRISEVVVGEGGKYTGLRVGLKDGGCSGYSYLLEFEAKPDEDDLVFEQSGAKVFVHPLHLPYLAGSALDWAEGELQAGFRLQNPNVKRSCGCGESFDI